SLRRAARWSEAGPVAQAPRRAAVAQVGPPALAAWAVASAALVALSLPRRSRGRRGPGLGRTMAPRGSRGRYLFSLAHRGAALGVVAFAGLGGSGAIARAVGHDHLTKAVFDAAALGEAQRGIGQTTLVVVRARDARRGERRATAHELRHCLFAVHLV